MGTVREGLAVAVSVLAVAGCSTSAPPEPSPSAAAAPIAIPVSEATWTDGPWPFAVTEGIVRCRYPYRVTFTTGGAEYALSSAAMSSHQFRDVGEIRRAGPVGYVEIDGTRQPVPTGPSTEKVLSLGLDLCP